MADTPVPEIGSETKKIVNPRAEIDTSPPFGSVKEAVTHFGGSGSWIPHHLLRLTAHHGMEEYDLDKVEEQAVELEKDLLVKERETLGVLKELEATKRFVEGLKLKLVKEVSECMAMPELSSFDRRLNLCPAPSPGLILMELNQAKMNLSKSTNNLATIQASVKSLNNKMRKEKIPGEKPPEKQIPNQRVLSVEDKNKGDFGNSPNMSRQIQQLNFEGEQFKKIAAAANTRKMEDAARAVEAVAFAEMKAQKPRDGYYKKPEETTIKEFRHGKKSQEEAYGKVEAAERRKFVSEEACFGGRMERDEMRQSGHNPATFKFKNSYPSYCHQDSQLLDVNESDAIEDKQVPVLRSTISIGDILSRKLILQDDFMVGNHVEGRTERQQVSLSQMLREQSGLIFESKKAVKDGTVHKQYFSQRKKFGFIDISLPLTKQSKKKSQALNLR
ncbi:WEB family protein [Actinidia rufa]|uniref:WEB family protein n=1 Tax=Actinidia rufa TaxID=165716 RepID=A0A7J0GWI2_9ERIC|nr:WEB family protein [Actinidia rufa]